MSRHGNGCHALRRLGPVAKRTASYQETKKDEEKNEQESAPQ